MSMMGSSKYEFEPDGLDIDYKDKMKVKEQFIKDINAVLDKEYKYRDTGQLSQNWKRQILLEIYRERYL